MNVDCNNNLKMQIFVKAFDFALHVSWVDRPTLKSVRSDGANTALIHKYLHISYQSFN